MLAIGGWLVCAALLALAAAVIVFRSPNPPPWTRWAGGPITLAIVTLFALGVAALIAGASRAAQEGVGAVDLGLLAAAVGITVAVWYKLDPRGRLRSMPAAPVAPTGGPGSSGSKEPGKAAATGNEPPPSRPRRRAA